MEFEFSHIFAATPADLWAFLLNPDRVSVAVPGMQSVEVVSDTEYNARIKVKIAFISAHFTLNVVIASMDAPRYLRADVTGQDNAIGSSLKTTAEMWLAQTAPGQTELRVTAKAQVLGRLGALGLNPMRTKAESMWAQFCATVETALAGGTDAPAAQPVVAPAATAAAAPAAARTSAPPAPATRPATPPAPARRGLFGWGAAKPAPGDIHVEIERGQTRIAMTFPASHAEQCLAWIDRQSAT